MIKKFSEAGEKILMKAEGFVAHIKPDAAGHPTIGYGHKMLPGEKYLVVSREMGLYLMRNDYKPIVDIINNFLPAKLKQNEFDALVIFIYNIGISSFLNSTVFKDIKDGKIESALMSWVRWINITKKTVDKTTGKVTKKLVPLKGLINRRALEVNLFKGE